MGEAMPQDEPRELPEGLTEPFKVVVNSAMRNWKEAGGKIVGYFCSYVPAELLTAAGLLPFRMRAPGSSETTLGDVFFSSYNCTFSRHCLDFAFRGEYGFLDGLISMNNCDHLRRVHDVWKRKIATPFLHFLAVPHKSGQAQVDWYREELAILRGNLERHFAMKVSDDDLWGAIRRHNQARGLQRQLYELRKKERPPITGSQVLATVVAGTALPVDDFNQLLGKLIEGIGPLEGDSAPRARLMVVGGILDDPAYLKVMEDLGGLVVADSLCFGSRIIWSTVDEAGSDPLEALARYYLVDRPQCPRMAEDYEARLGFIRSMVEEFRVDGVVCERLQFCELWGGEDFRLAPDLKEAGIPLLLLDREYRLTGVGQLRTRVQAFLETLGR